MKNSRLVPLLAVTLIMMSGITASFAQTSNPPADTMEKPAETPPSSGTGTAPEGMGSTGWTGGSRGQTKDSTTTAGENAGGQNTDDAKDQPPVATGEDLKGPAAQFPASNTPE